jgi:hypothetical protein
MYLHAGSDFVSMWLVDINYVQVLYDSMYVRFLKQNSVPELAKLDLIKVVWRPKLFYIHTYMYANELP